MINWPLLMTLNVPSLLRSGYAERLKGVGIFLSPVKALIRSPSLLAVDCNALLVLYSIRHPFC